MPTALNMARKRFFRPPRSAMLPSSGASNTTTKLDTELATPSQNVRAPESSVLAQYCSKKSGTARR